MLLQTGMMIVVTASKNASTVAAIVSTTALITGVTASKNAWTGPLIVHLMPAGIVFQTVSIVKAIASTAGWTIGVIG